MTTRRTLLTAALSLGLAAWTAGSAHAQETIRAVTDATFPPMEFVKDGKRTGFDIELVEALAGAMGKKVEWIDIDFKGLIPALQAGRADIAVSAIYITPERSRVVDFTDPYYAGGLVVLTKKDGPIKTLKDMDGRKVSVQVGTKSVNYLKEHFPSVQRVEVEKNQEMFSLVQIGRAEAAVTGKPAAKLFAQSTPDLTVLTEQVTTEEYGIAVPKNKPELTRDLNAALAKLKADGSYQAIVNKWFEAPRNEPAFGFFRRLCRLRRAAARALVSIEVTAGALLVGCVVGLLVGVGRLNPQRRVIYNLCSVYLLLFRGTPLLVQLFIWFFGLPRFGITLPAFVCGVVGLGMYSGAYVSEIVRGAIQSVDRGQTEAARSLGMSSGQAMRIIILPQAVVRMIPPLGNEFIALIKNSALVSLLTIHDLMHEGQKIISVSYLALETYLVVALVYLVLTTVAMVILRKIEQHLRAGDGAMNTATMNEMIRIRGLQKSYGDHAVLRGIDFDVLPSQVVVVIGPSGSGKSTLLRCCNGLEVAQGGTVRICGQTLQDNGKMLPEAQLNQLRMQVGMVFQGFNLFPPVGAGQRHGRSAQAARHGPTRPTRWPRTC